MQSLNTSNPAMWSGSERDQKPGPLWLLGSLGGITWGPSLLQAKTWVYHLSFSSTTSQRATQRCRLNWARETHGGSRRNLLPSCGHPGSELTEGNIQGKWSPWRGQRRSSGTTEERKSTMKASAFLRGKRPLIFWSQDPFTVIKITEEPTDFWFCG